MRIVFFGSSKEAADALDGLIIVGHSVVAAYTQPDRKAGRGLNRRSTPVKQLAEITGIPVFTPKSLNEEKNRLTEFGADVFVVMAYGRILPLEVLQIPPIGVVNVHPSLLPNYRGPSPVVASILDGLTETGVSIMLLDTGMDTGPILAQSKPIQLTGKEKTAELQSSLFKIGSEMLPQVLEGLADGSIFPQAQDESLATVTGLLKRSDGAIDWSDSAVKIERMIRAYDPWPGTFTNWNGNTLKIIAAAIFDTNSLFPGEVLVEGGLMIVGCGSGSIQINSVQLEGRQKVSATDFINGASGLNGSILRAIKI